MKQKHLFLIKGRPAVITPATPDVEVEFPVYFRKGNTFLFVESEQKYTKLITDKYEKSIKQFTDLYFPEDFDLLPEYIIDVAEYNAAKNDIMAHIGVVDVPTQL